MKYITKEQYLKLEEFCEEYTKKIESVHSFSPVYAEYEKREKQRTGGWCRYSIGLAEYSAILMDEDGSVDDWSEAKYVCFELRCPYCPIDWHALVSGRAMYSMLRRAGISAEAITYVANETPGDGAEHFVIELAMEKAGRDGAEQKHNSDEKGGEV